MDLAFRCHLKLLAIKVVASRMYGMLAFINPRIHLPLQIVRQAIFVLNTNLASAVTFRLRLILPQV
jgi:hypothetical protein